MNETVVTALPYFSGEGEKIAESMDGTFIPYRTGLFGELFRSYRNIIAIMAIGIVMRNIAPYISDKWRDPAIVVISPDIRFAIPVIGGHHGGNDLAYQLQTRCGLVPVITTATEATGRESVEVLAKREHLRIVNTRSTRQANAAVLTGHAGIYRIMSPGMVIAGPGVSFLVAAGRYSVGIGCRLGTTADEIMNALHEAFRQAGIKEDEVAIYASVSLKSHEQGLLDAVRKMNGTIIFLNPGDLLNEEIVSDSAASRFGIPGVAEPAALAVSEHHTLILEKHVYGNITVAIAE